MKNLTLYNNTYPELTNWGVVSREQLRSEVTRIVRSLYGPATPSARIADAIQAAAVEPLGLFTVNTVALTPVAPIEESEVKVKAKEQAVFKTPEKKEETPTFQSVTLPAEISTAGRDPRGSERTLTYLP